MKKLFFAIALITAPNAVVLANHIIHFTETNTIDNVDIISHLTYELSDNGYPYGATILKATNVASGSSPYVIRNIVSVNGNPFFVTNIANSAFSDNIGLLKVEIPNTIRDIGPYAFKNCTALSEITFDNVQHIGEGAFANNSALRSITIPPTVLEIGDYAFSNCTALASIEFLGAPGYVGTYGLRYIGKRPFVNTAIPELNIPDTLLDMDGNITAGAPFNMKLNISDSSHFTFSDDGVLYNKDMTKLYACPTRAEGTVIIPSSVTNICQDAFFGCFRLSYLNIPANVDTIGSDAFNVYGIWPDLIWRNRPPQESVPKLQYVFYEGSNEIAHAENDIYDHAPSSLTNFVFSENWPTNGWKNRPVVYIPPDDSNIPVPVLSYKDENGITWFYRIIKGTAEIYNEEHGKSCAAIKPTSISGVLYTRSEDDVNTISAYGLRIPYSINGFAVTSIGSNAFENCSALVCIGLPASVQKIGDYAFKGCTALRSIDEYYNAPFFVTEGKISLPVGITEIGYHAFEGLNLTSISMPYTLTSTKGNPLAGPGHLTTVEVDSRNSKFSIVDNVLYDKRRKTVIGVPANYNDGTIHFQNSVTMIGYEALYGCANLDTITLSDTLETISSNALACCTSITSLIIPETVKTIGAAAFMGCNELTNVTYSGGVPQNVDTNIYYGATNVISMVNNNSPEIISNWVTNAEIESCEPSTNADNTITTTYKGSWMGCPIIITQNSNSVPPKPEHRVTIDDITWYYNITNEVAEISAVKSDKPIMSFTLPNVLDGYIVKGIGDRALTNLLGITSIAIPNTYEWIGDYAFSNCTSLASVSLGNSVERIGHWPFFGTKITTLEIPDSVSEIDGNPVAGCSLMQAVVVEDSQPHFSVDDGLLYDKNQETLIACPATKTSISYPETWKATNDDALYGCHIIDPNFTTIDGVTWGFTVTDDGKAKITSVQGATGTIEIPASLSGFEVAEIEDGVFADSPDVEAFASRSAAFRVRNGALYSADGKTLICVPNTMKLPYSVITSNITVTVTERHDAGVGSNGLPYVNVTTTTNASSARISTQQFAGDISFETLLAGVTRICDKAFSGVNVFTNSYTAVTNGPSIGEAIPGNVTVHSFVKTTSIEIQGVSYATSIAINPTLIAVTENAFAGSGIVYKTTTSPGQQPPNQPPVVVPPVDDPGGQFTFSGLPPTTASTYDGYLTDGSGSLVGTIQVKVPKAKRGKAKIRATIRIAGKSSTARGTLDFSTGEVDGLDLTLGENGMAGTYRGYEIIGARNMFTSKEKSEVATANAILRPWLGAINVAWDGGVMSVTISAKGKVKISGTTANGTKISATSQILIGDDWLCAPIVIAKKANVAFLLKLSTTGNGVETEGIDGAIAGRPGTLRTDAELTIANGSIPSKLKLKPNSKTGTFKGSFRAFGTNGKSISVTIAGVTINGVGYGVAYAKKTTFSTITIR